MFYLFVSLVVFAIADFYRRRQRDEARRLEQERDPRVEGGPQFAGAQCSHCEESILMQDDGMACRTCSITIHRACSKAHRLAAHDKAAGYRRDGRAGLR